MGSMRTFGVEIECGVPNRDAYFGSAWDNRYDSTLSDINGDCLDMVEYVSPVLKGEMGIRKVIEFCKQISRAGASVNRTCGLHVHVGSDGYTRRMVDRLERVFEEVELAFYGMAGFGINNRMTLRSYCKPKRETETLDRYRSLNLTNLFFDGTHDFYEATDDGSSYGDGSDQVSDGTFEVRAYGPSTNWKKVAGAVILAVGVIDAVACGFEGWGMRFQTPREAMLAMIALINENRRYIPSIDEETLDAILEQCRTQATNATSVVRGS